MENLGSSSPIWVQGFLPWIQDSFFENLGSWIWIQDLCPRSKKSCLNILGLGAWIWIQDFCTSWILIMSSDLRFSSLNSLQNSDSQIKVTEVKPKKQKRELQTKTWSEQILFLLLFSLWFSRGFAAMHTVSTSFKSSSSRFSKILHAFKFGWTPSQLHNLEGEA